MSSFRHRNALYLRITPYVVLPLYLYLDDKHLNWMSDNILKTVIADLKPLILQKWKEESPFRDEKVGASHKRFGLMGLHRGDTYQVAFFLKKNQTHSLLVKTRNFTLAPPQATVPSVLPEEGQSSKARTKQKGKGKSTGSSKKTKSQSKKGKRKRVVSDEDEDSVAGEDDVEEQVVSRRSTRGKRPATGTYAENEEDGLVVQDPAAGQPDMPHQDSGIDNPIDVDEDVEDPPVRVKEEYTDESYSALLGAVRDASISQDGELNLAEDISAMPPPTLIPSRPGFGVDDDEEEEKPKPILNLEYNAFNIPDICLSIIVEPWPLVATGDREGTREPSVIPQGKEGNISRFLGARPQSRAPSEIPQEDREKTPLFREETPFGGEADFVMASTSSHAGGRVLPPVPLFHSDSPEAEANEDEDDGTRGLMYFSQAVNRGEANRAEDEEEEDDNAFAGDADEGG